MTIDAIFNVIRQAICAVLPQLAERQLQRTDVLETLGANSIDRADIVLMTLEQLNLNIPLTEVYGPRNIGELAELLHAKLQTA